MSQAQDTVGFICMKYELVKADSYFKLYPRENLKAFIFKTKTKEEI